MQNDIIDSILAISSPKPHDTSTRWQTKTMSCAYPCVYVDSILTSKSYVISIIISTRATNMSILLVFMLMLPVFSLAYTCACAYAYALVKTRL